MDHLVHVEEKEITINFELGRKCKTVLCFHSLMHTMPVAFKLQTTSPYKFSVRPSNGYVRPLAEFTLEIILKPQQEPPPTFPFSDEKFVLKTALPPFSNDNSVLPERVCKEWFSSPTTHIYIDAKLKVVYIGAHLLRQCVAREDVFAVEQMLMRQTGVSVAAEDGRTALHVAASTGSSKLVDMLLQCGAEVDAMDAIGRTPLWEAISGGHVDLVKELLARGAHTDVSEPFRNNSTSAIHVAATLASPKVLEVLIENGASLETKDQEGRTALHFAVEMERIESLKVLICAGADINSQRADGRTPLLIAAENGSLQMVHLLLEGGANTNIKAENGQAACEVASEKGHVVIVEALKAGEELLRAARRGDVKAVATLLQHGGGNKAWAQDSAGWTALHVAAFKGNVQIVRRLLLAEGGTKALQERDAEGHTPLHCAAEGGSREVVELLLAMGANPLAASSRGARPAELASALGFTPIARLLHQRAIHCLDAKGLERMCSPITKSRRLSRQSVSPSPKPGPNLSSFRMRSASPSPNHKEALTAASIRFSTPKKLPQSKQQLHNKPCSNPSCLLIHADEVPQCTKLDSLTDKKNLAPSQPQASSTPDMCKSSDVKSTLHLDAQKVLNNAAQSKHPFLQPMPLSASLEQPTALEPLKATKVEETAPTIHAQHAVPGQIVDHRKDINSLVQSLQKPFLRQSHNIQQKSEKEDYNAATSMPQQITLKSSNDLQDSHKHHPKRTLADLLDRVHGSKMEGDSSSSRKSIQNKMPLEIVDNTSNQRDKSTTKKVAIPTSGMVSQDRTFLQNQLQDGRNLVSGNKHCLRQDAASMFRRDKSTVKEVAIPTLDMHLQDREFIRNQVRDRQNLADGNQQGPRPYVAPLFQRHKSPAAIPTSDMCLQDRAFVQNPVKDSNQHCPRKDAASLYQRNKSTTKAITPSSDMLLQDRAFVQNQVKDDHNVNNGNHNSVRQNAASQHQRSKSTTKEAAIPTSDKDRAPIQNITHARAAHGHQHPIAASSLSKQSCKEAQTRLLKTKVQQQLTNGADLKRCPEDPPKLNGADLKRCPKDPPKINVSLSKNEDHAQQNSRTLSATQPQLLIVHRSTSIKVEEPSKPLFEMQPHFLTGNAIVGDEGASLDNPVSAAQAIRGPAFIEKNNISSALPCCKIDGNMTVEDTSCSTSSRSLVSQSDLVHIPTTPNPADSVLQSRPHMEQACPSISTSSSVWTSPDKLLQSKHNHHVHNHFASSDVPQRCPMPPTLCPMPPTREMMRDIDTHIMPPHQSTSPPCKTDQMLQLEETQSLKPTCKASWNDQNRPVYTPPLRIKQMRKPMSTPILRNSNSPQQMRTEEVPTKATGTSEEKPAKARSVTFRELFSQGTF